MNELNFLIVDDNASSALALEKHIKEISKNTIYQSISIGKVKNYLGTKTVDLVIIKISLDNQPNGILLATDLKEKNIPFLFITDSTDANLFYQAKATSPIGYLVEPFNKFSLQHIIEVAFRKKNDHSLNDVLVNDALFVKQNNLLRKIPFDAVLWIKTEGNYSIIHTKEKRYILKLSLKKVLEQLPKNYFLQIQRAYIVALPQIEDIDIAANDVIVNKERLPLGRNYREALFNCLKILK